MLFIFFHRVGSFWTSGMPIGLTLSKLQVFAHTDIILQLQYCAIVNVPKNTFAQTNSVLIGGQDLAYGHGGHKIKVNLVFNIFLQIQHYVGNN